jgi:hypothetical protein
MDRALAFASQLRVVEVGERRKPLEPPFGVILAGRKQRAARGVVMEVLTMDGVWDGDGVVLDAGDSGVLAQRADDDDCPMDEGGYRVKDIGK